MRTLLWRSLPLLGLFLAACVPIPLYRDAQHESDLLKQAALQNQDVVQDRDALADRSTHLALQNHYLKIGNAELLKGAAERDAFYGSVMRDLRGQVEGGRMKIRRYQDMLSLDVADEILFDSAKAALKPDGREVLLAVAKAIAKSDKTVRVAGHTDDQPLAEGAAFASNWELSTARATTVVRYLQEKGGLDPHRLLAAGRGEWMPVASNKTPQGRQRNRRITITLIDKGLLDDSEGAAATGGEL